LLKYLKYFIPGFTGIITIIMFLMGEYYPTLFLIGFSLFIIIGDVIFPRDKEIQQFSYPSLLNLFYLCKFTYFIYFSIISCIYF